MMCGQVRHLSIDYCEMTDADTVNNNNMIARYILKCVHKCSNLLLLRYI